MDIKIESSQDQDLEAEVLFMSIGEGAIVTDAKGNISKINNKALEILGFKEKDLLGKWFPEAIYAEDESGDKLLNLERPIAEVFITGKAVATRTYYRRKDGSRVPVYLTVSPIMMDGRPIGAIEVFHDITAELALEKAKDEFVAIASHQLRTPATAVKQYVGLLLEGYAEPLKPSQKMFLERAYESNERQLNIVQEILKITQLDLEKVVLQLDLYDIREVAKEAAASLAGLFKNKRQALDIKAPAQAVWGNVDKEQLRVAIENLLENASNYSMSGKRIVLEVKASQESIQIIISDEGVGISKKDFPKLFQKFSRVPNPLSIEAGGTGLGLYWAAKIVGLHNGTIEVKSKAKKGSSFIIRIPL